MLSWFGRYVLATTALAPISLAYAWSAYLEKQYLTAIILTAASPVLLALCALILRAALKSYERLRITPKSVEATDREGVALLVLYLLPLFTYKFNDLQWNVIIPSIIVLGVVVSTGYNFYFSPLLGLLGWHSYKVGDAGGMSYVLITKRQLRYALQEIEVVQLTEYVVLEVSKDGR